MLSYKIALKHIASEFKQLQWALQITISSFMALLGVGEANTQVMQFMWKYPQKKNGCHLELCATLMSRVQNCFHWWSQVYAYIISYPKWICQAYFHNTSVVP